MSLDKIESIKKISKEAIKSTDIIAEGTSKTPNKDYFESLMLQQSKKKEASTTQELQATNNTNNKKPTLMDEVSELSRRVDKVTKVTPTELVTQAQDVIATIDTLKDKLNSPNLELKGSVQNILRNKLTHIDDNLRIALSKAGVEYKEPDKNAASQGRVNPIERFLGYLTDGQNQLQSLSGEIQKMSDKNGEFSPGDMLLIQIKVGYIQQELEFFTSLLNKALESTKTVMNVQV